MHVDSRWGTSIGCKSLWKIVVKVHEKSVDHISIATHWEVVQFCQCENTSLVIQRVNIVVDRKQSTIIIVMKFLYFTI